MGDNCAWCGPAVHPEEGFCAPAGSQCSSRAVSDPGQAREGGQQRGGGSRTVTLTRLLPFPPLPLLQCPSLSGSLEGYRGVVGDVATSFAATLTLVVAVSLSVLACQRKVVIAGTIGGRDGSTLAAGVANGGGMGARTGCCCATPDPASEVVFLYRVGVVRVM